MEENNNEVLAETQLRLIHHPQHPLLIDLPSDVLVRIARYMDAKDIIHLKSTCKRFHFELQKEEIWEYMVQKWVYNQDYRSGITSIAPQRLKNTLGGGTDEMGCGHSFQTTYRRLHLLGHWPAGYWSSSDAPWSPTGIMLRVDHNHESFHFNFITPIPTTNSSRAVYSLRPICVLVIHPSKEHKNMDTISMNFSNSNIERVIMADDGTSLGIQWQSQPWPIPSSLYIPSAMRNTTTSNTQQQTDRRYSTRQVYEYLAGLGRVTALGDLSMLHRPCLPSKSMLPSWYNTDDLYLPLGLYTGSYSIHGFEILQIGPPATTNAPPPPLCPIETPYRLEALKLTGDPNVPASKISFIVDVQTDRHDGPYQSVRDDPSARVLGIAPRPIATFHPTDGLPNIEVVDLESRPVSVVFHNAMGQINRVAGQWNPEWQRAMMVCYQGTDSFSVLFQDENEPIRHLIDFHPFPEADCFLDGV